MAQDKGIYKIKRECTKCRHTEEIFVSKREAAFELIDISNIIGQICKKCSSTSFHTTYSRPDLDFDLIKEWAMNTDLYLIPQDEELLLAEERYLEIILQILDVIPILDYKRDLLMEALCVIVYDNTNEDNSQKDNELKERVIKELNKRQEKLKMADNWISDYIKEVVYPQLDFFAPQ